MSPRIRPATEADLEAVAAVAEASWYAAYGGFLEPAVIEGTLSETYDTEILAAALEHDEIAFYVAEADEVIGFASAEQTWADEVELHTVYVHPDRWGEGTGAALLDEIETWARDQGADRIACGVFADNAVGVGFFESRGFERGAAADAEIGGELHPEYEFERPL
jgi:ribosomal protein S18 acetylase RimI-like enzyme